MTGNVLSLGARALIDLPFLHRLKFLHMDIIISTIHFLAILPLYLICRLVSNLAGSHWHNGLQAIWLLRPGAILLHSAALNCCDKVAILTSS